MRDEHPSVRLLKLKRLAKLEQNPHDPSECVEADVEHLRFLEGILLGQRVHLRKGRVVPESRGKVEQVVDLHHGNGMWAKGLELAIVCPVSGLIVCPELFIYTA